MEAPALHRRWACAPQHLAVRPLTEAAHQATGAHCFLQTTGPSVLPPPSQPLSACVKLKMINKNNPIKPILVKGWTILFGIGLGLMSSLIVMTIIRILIKFLFGWGDSGPEWVNLLIIPVMIVVAISTAALFVKWSLTHNRET